MTRGCVWELVGGTGTRDYSFLCRGGALLLDTGPAPVLYFYTEMTYTKKASIFTISE